MSGRTRWDRISDAGWPRVRAWGQRPLGRLAFWLLRRWCPATATGYQAWVRAQCGQPTEVVTSASKA